MTRVRLTTASVALCLLFSALSAQASIDLEFFITSDTHLDNDRVASNRTMIQEMNGMPTNVDYPGNVGGTVGTPRGVLITGDLTNSGYSSQWNQYTDHYPVNGGTGTNQIHYPVREIAGNHDYYDGGSHPVASGVAVRQGGLNHSWDWSGVHFVGLDVYPSSANSDWLANDLASVGSQTPVVIMTHYGFTYGADPTWHHDWWDSGYNGQPGDWDTESVKFKNTINGKNVIAIIHGHGHTAAPYIWEGYNVYTPGSPKSGDPSYGVVKINGNKFSWSEWNWETDNWVYTDKKIITVPEPISLSLLALGGLALLRRRRAAWIVLLRN